MFVKVCDVTALIRANSLGADFVAHCLFLTVDLTEGPICILLPVNFITVYLTIYTEGEKESERLDWELERRGVGK